MPNLAPHVLAHLQDIRVSLIQYEMNVQDPPDAHRHLPSDFGSCFVAISVLIVSKLVETQTAGASLVFAIPLGLLARVSCTAM